MLWVAVDTPKASAQVQLYPWSACSYAYLQYGVGTLIPARDVTVAVNPWFPLPGDAPIDAAHDWVQNPFRSRLSEAIHRPTGLATSANRSRRSNANEPDAAIIDANITIDTSNTWFTQDDSRRAYWEGCPAVGNIPVYTCSKNDDVGATFIHELGHALGLRDVQLLDETYGNTAATTAASCNVFGLQATMCGVARQYSSAQRTLDTYDSTALFLHDWNALDIF